MRRLNARKMSFVVCAALHLSAFAPHWLTAAPLFPDPLAAAGNLYLLASGDFNGDRMRDLFVSESFPCSNICFSYPRLLFGRVDGSFEGQIVPSIQTPYGNWLALDLDGDGRDDLVDAYFDSAWVYLSQPDGSFSPPVRTGVGGDPGGIFADDFNRDGHVDLALVVIDQDRVAILLGDGTGRFSRTNDYPVDDYPGFVEGADFNRDGKIDLAITNFFSDSLSILLGEGDGTFGSAQSAVSPLRPRGLAAGDFNGDGHPDLAVSYGGEVGGLLISGVSLLRGRGDGTFDLQQPFLQDDLPSAMAARDLNLDGRTDLVLGRYGRGVDIYLGDAGGSLTFKETAANAAHSGGFLIDDFSLDGRPDLVASGYRAGLYVLRGNGDTFGGQRRVPAGREPAAIAAGDFNSDLRPDLVVANSGSDDVSLFRLIGAGRFATEQRFRVGDRPQALGTGDFNSDHRLDAAVSNAGSGDVSILLADGRGGFGPEIRLPVGDEPGALAVADFNGDGMIDLAAGNLGDGAPDATSGRITVRLGQSGAVLGGPVLQIDLGGTVVSLAGGNLNGDGNTDLVAGVISKESDPYLCFRLPVPCQYARTEILLGSGDGTFVRGSPLSYPRSHTPAALSLLDVNRDGAMDIAQSFFASPYFPGEAGTDFFDVRYGRGDGTFEPYASDTTVLPLSIDTLGVSDFVFGDFDADGVPEPLLANAASSDIMPMRGNEQGQFDGGVRYLVGSGPAAVAAADFNSDGRLDVATANLGSDDVSIVLNQGPFPILNVGIDVRPGDPSNVVNTRAQGVLPVAISSTARFDAGQVDPATIRLSGGAIEEAGEIGGARCHGEDVNSDGLADLFCLIDMRGVSLAAAQTSIVLEGRTREGRPIRGEDRVRVVGR